jgi:hypothetical protein
MKSDTPCEGESLLPLWERAESLHSEAGGETTLLGLRGGATILIALFVLVGRMKSLSKGFSLRRYFCVLLFTAAIEQEVVLYRPGLAVNGLENPKSHRTEAQRFIALFEEC